MSDDEEKDLDNFQEIIESPKSVDIRERAFAFAVRFVKLCKFLEKILMSAKILSINYLMPELRTAQTSKKQKPVRAKQILFIKTQFHLKKRVKQISD
jgi:hypothetical protein